MKSRIVLVKKGMYEIYFSSKRHYEMVKTLLNRSFCRYLRGRGGILVNIDGSDLDYRDLYAIVSILKCDMDQDTMQSIYNGVLEEIHIQKERLVKSVEGVEVDYSLLPEGVKLFDHQTLGSKYIVKSLLKNRGFLLADEPRIGKTFVGLFAFRNLFPNGRLIVVCPANIVSLWKGHIKNWNISGDVYSFEKFRNIYEDIIKSGISYDFMIIDEIHKARNGSSKVFSCLNLFIGSHINMKVLGLSGTIFQNYPTDLVSILSLLRIESDFVKNSMIEYSVRLSLKGGHSINIKRYDWNLGMIKDVRKNLVRTGCYLRREARDVSGSDYNLERLFVRIKLGSEDVRVIEEKTRKILEEKGLGELMESRLEDAMRYLFGKGERSQSFIHDLLISIALLKVRYIGEKVISLLESNSTGIIIFAHHIRVHEEMERYLLDRGIRVGRLVSSMSMGRKERQIERFRNGEVDVILLPISGASEGLDLSRADSVIFLELDWNPTKMEQAEKRIINIKDARPKASYYFVTNTRLEQSILRIVNTKIRNEVLVYNSGKGIIT